MLNTLIRVVKLNAMVCLLSSLAFPCSVFAQNQQFNIRSISFPLVGTNYLDEMTGWTSIPTVIQQIIELIAV